MIKPWVYRIFDLVARDGSLVVREHNPEVYRVIIKFPVMNGLEVRWHTITDTFALGELSLWWEVLVGTIKAMEMQGRKHRGEEWN